MPGRRQWPRGKRRAAWALPRAFVSFFLLIAFEIVVRSVGSAQPNRKSPPELIAHTGHSSAITAVAFAHHKPMLAAGSYDGAVKVWDITSGMELFQLANGGGEVEGLALSPSDQRLAVGSQDGKVRVWDLTSRTSISALDASGPVRKLALSQDGKWMAAATESGRITVWNALTLDSVLRLQDVESISGLVFTPDDSLRSVNANFWDPKIPHSDIMWAIPSGTVLRERKHIVPVAFKADGSAGLWSSVPTGKDEDTESLEDASGAPIAHWKFTTKQEEIDEAQLSPDGTTLVTDSMDMSRNAHEFTFVRLLDAHTGKILATLSGADENAAMNNLVEFSPDGRMLAVVSGNDIAFYDTATRRRQGQIAWAAVSSYIKFSPHGHWLGMIVNRTLKLWDLDDGSLAMNLGPVSAAARIAFSNDDRYVASWDFDPETLNLRAEMKRYFIKVWDLRDGGEVRTEMDDGPLDDVAFSPDGSEFAYSVNAVVVLCESKTGKVLATMKEDLDYVTYHWLDFSSDGSRILDFSDHYNIYQWNIPSGTLRSARHEDGDPRGVRNAVDGSPGSQAFAYLDYKNTVRTWDFSDGARSELLIKDAGVDALAFSPGMKTLAVGNDSDSTVVLCDIKPLKERTRILLHGGVRSLGYSPDGRWLAAGLSNGETDLVNTATSDVAARMFVMGSSSDWMMISPSGEFDGSDRGLHTLLAWRFDLQQYPVDRFFRDFYAPRLLPRLLSGEAPIPRLGLEALGFPPSVHIVSDKLKNQNAGLMDIEVRAFDQGGGVKEIRLLQNGKLIDVHPVGSQIKGFAQARFTVKLADGENRFDATAFNQHDVESEGDVVWINHGSTSQKPVLHILAVGINRYADSNLNLESARPDSEAVAEAFHSHAGNLFSRVDLVTVADKEATADEIRKSLRELKTRTAPGDVVVLYLAGHGKNIGERFFFFAHDAEASSGATARGVLSAEEIGAALLDNAALKQLVIFDTCESGAAVKQIASLSNSAITLKAEKSLSRGIGINILSATTDVEREREAPNLAHSRLATAILEGMGSATHFKTTPNEGKTITVASLIAYVKARMAQITGGPNIGHQGSMSEETGVDFPIGVR